MKLIKIITTVFLFVLVLAVPSLVLATKIDYCAGVSFGGVLKVGSTGQEVSCLQVLLNSDKSTVIVDSGPGSPENETDFFGRGTYLAVIKFQEKYTDEILKPSGLSKGNGFIGVLTQKKLNSLLKNQLGLKQMKVSTTIKGKASYYASFFQGKKTASGQLYDNNKYTAAHKTLPFGTIVRVTNTANGRSAVVKINDRGPFVKGRLIDLSRIAARDIGVFGPGIINAKVEVLK